MKAFLFTLLAAVLCMEQASSLSCFTCTDEPSDWNCLRSKVCAESDKFCLTIYASGGIGNNSGKRITKKCSPVCPKANMDIGLEAISSSCCEHSLCNVSGASSVKTSFVVMATGILASLTYVLRTGL
ncbi:lymphocyte antigen 6E-like [Emydura macquarii macquarii]|uniref:lymphocyte antigen 6E-like n=1 Tax=Emydura macquarii macquarii TaxID=1129001 RepID=UPI00352A1ACC